MRILNKDFHLMHFVNCIREAEHAYFGHITVTLGLGKSFVQKQSSQFYKQRENKLF